MILLLFLALSPSQHLYEDGKYFAAIEQAEKALKDTALTLQDRVGIHTVLGFCYVALNKERLARLEFLEALALDPELQLDPVLTSPKIMKLFQDAKAGFRFSPGHAGIYRDTLLPGPKKNIAAFAIPGIWSIKKGNKKGYLLLTWSCASLLSLGTSHYQCEKYHQEYLDARTPSMIENSYEDYNLWYQARTYSLVSLALSYTLNLFVLAISP